MKIQDKNLFIRKYFEENYFVQSNIDSFDSLIEWRLQGIVDSQGEAVPAVVPPDVEEIKFRFGKLTVGKPKIIEADGADRALSPMEARLRNLTYSAPIFLEVELVIDGKERERELVQIAELPIMLKSKGCYLNKVDDKDLVKLGEDPNDPGGYFIIDGTERVLVLLEDLAPNTVFAKKEKTGPATHSARIFSASTDYRVPLKVERNKEGIYQVSFSTIHRIPFVILLKALGVRVDKDILETTKTELNEDMYLNLYEYKDITTTPEAQEIIAKHLHLTLPKERKLQRVQYILDNLLLPHIGKEPKHRSMKANFLGRMVRKVNQLKEAKIKEDDKDHYMNKRVRMAGDLLEDLFRTNFKVLVNDLLYIFQRGVRRGRISPITTVVRTKLMTSRIKSAMATGKWTANRQGVSQRLERDNMINTFSNLQRVVSLLESNRESFQARELHPTHWGRLCPLESPEGKNIGLRKNLALLCNITPALPDSEINKAVKILKQIGMKEIGEARDGSDIFMDGSLAGEVTNPESFVDRVISERRKGNLTKYINIYYDPVSDTITALLDKNRARRPLIIAENGKSLLKEKHLEALRKGKLSWNNLIEKSLIEELDALEEESSLVTVDEKDLTKKHTHLEINPVAILGITSSLVPFANHTQSSRLATGQKNQKQSSGLYTANYLNRLDTNVNLLHYPQQPVVKSFTQEMFNKDLVGGQNIIIAILSYEGYNLEDAVVMNRASIDRGLYRSTHYRPYAAEKLRYSGGQIDEIRIPDKDTQGYTIEDDYRFLGDDGIIYPEVEVEGGEVLMGKTSPPRFLSKLESFSTTANIRKDTSVRVKFGEKGFVSKVFLTESEDGNPLIRTEVRDSRIPEIGDKFSSRHGQKGIIGLVANPEDVPFTASGIQPDLIFSPFGMRRITVSHLIESLAGKVGALAGRYINGTPFSGEDVEELRKELFKLGFKEDSTEVLYDGRTGKEYKARVFVGNIFYMRLKYQVADKIQARGRGRVALLTRQPTAGKAMEGGLRFGEMEKETLVGHGASLLMKERFDSDRTVTYTCERCGDIAMYDYYKNKTSCITCGDKSKAHPIEMSYAFKVFLDELKSMGIRPRLILKDRFQLS